MKNALVLVGLAAAVVVGVLYAVEYSSDDDVPIYVKNGSLVIEPEASPDNSWAWTLELNGDNEDSSPSYSLEPANKYRDRSRTLWVKVNLAGGTNCSQGNTANGQMVAVQYGANTFTARFKRGRSGPIDYRTKVRPANDLKANGTALRYAGEGFITKVTVGGWSCDITTREMLDSIAICSSDTPSECK